MIFNNGFISSQLNKYLKGSVSSVGEYNANNTWNFNGNNRYLNNNNRYNSNFRSRPCSDYITTGNKSVSLYVVPLEKIQEIEELCKSPKTNYIRFRVNKIHNIIQVWHNINNNNIKILSANVFTAKVPKLREIIYCNYSDKLAQSFYVFSLKTYLEENWFDEDSYSCRDNKGVLKAVQKYRYYINIALKEYSYKEIYLASIDIHRFFLSIDSKFLAIEMGKFIQKYLKNHPCYKILLNLTKCLYVINWHEVAIDRIPTEISPNIPAEKRLLSNPPYIGVPIGNWPSQIGGNFITTFALVFIRGLGYNMFVHYTDDTNFVITDKNKFLKDLPIIERFYMEILHLELHKKKRYLQHQSKGITMLGRRIKFTRCIASKMTINSIDSFIYGKIQACKRNKNYMRYNAESFSQSINSYLGLLVHMTMFKYKKWIINLINRVYNEYFIVDFKEYRKINVKKKYTTKQKYINYIKTRKIQLCKNLEKSMYSAI
ncbi:MAG: hypothetical protein IKO36_09935 [Bacteroidaceae bacterium]|nr:hypothetical protein [Bacteroidaceae bacterium]